MHFPTIHSNGSDPVKLMADLQGTIDAIGEAISRFQWGCCPSVRDFYEQQPIENFEKAIRKWDLQFQALKKIYIELMELLDNIRQQANERAVQQDYQVKMVTLSDHRAICVEIRKYCALHLLNKIVGDDVIIPVKIHKNTYLLTGKVVSVNNSSHGNLLLVSNNGFGKLQPFGTWRNIPIWVSVHGQSGVLDLIRDQKAKHILQEQERFRNRNES